MNSYMVSKVTQGLADYLNTASDPSVVISYDSRNYSDLFAMQQPQTKPTVSVFLYRPFIRFRC